MKTDKEIEKVLLKYGQFVVHEMTKMLAHTTTLKRSIKPIVHYDKQGPILTFEMPSYAIFVNDGRRKGAKQPPLKPIMDWARKKLPPIKAVNNMKAAETSRAFLIARSIKRNGIKPIPFMELAYKHLSKLASEIGTVAAGQVADSIRMGTASVKL